MAARKYKPKVAQLDQVKLDFPDMDDDPNLKDAAEELKRRGQASKTPETSKKRPNPEGTRNPELEVSKRVKTD
jgi:hypothetical protein